MVQGLMKLHGPQLTPEESEALDAAVKKALAWLEEHGALMESVRTGTQVSVWTGPPAPEPAAQEPATQPEEPAAQPEEPARPGQPVAESARARSYSSR